MSRAFTKEDAWEEPVIPPRAALPDGVPNYVTPRGVQALRAALAAAEPGARRSELERQVAAAVPAPPPADRDEIRFGARVTMRDRNGDMRRVQIVGVDEASPAAGLIAFVAPLARALLGRRVGDAVTVRAPGGSEELEVLTIDYDDDDV